MTLTPRYDGPSETAPTCRVCSYPIEGECAFDPAGPGPDPKRPSVLHPNCAAVVKRRLAVAAEMRDRVFASAGKGMLETLSDLQKAVDALLPKITGSDTALVARIIMGENPLLILRESKELKVLQARARDALRMVRIIEGRLVEAESK